MLKFIRTTLLNQKQAKIKARYDNVHITLHAEMPSPSMNKMVEVCRVVEEINKLEPEISALSDGQLRARSDSLRERVRKDNEAYEERIRELREEMDAAAIPEEKEKIRARIKTERNKAFEPVLPEAFALVREASKRTTGLRHFDVQLAGGIVLHEGRIAEMATGEGKTLVATLPVYLNALLGRGVHVVTVNDYLARRDREWMGSIYEFLGLSVGVIQHEMSDDQRKAAYACDITYGTNNEFGFDYLRDNMKYATEDLVQRPFFYAVVDEVDSILIDEARTPLIISGPAEESTDKYYTAQRIADQLKGKRITNADEIDAKHKEIDLSAGVDYLANENLKTVSFSDSGEVKAASLWGVESLHTIDSIELRHHTIQAVLAKEFYHRDVDYVVKDKQVIIVDEFTGRLMPGRRWSDGLHQAVESKEGLKIERENQTLATITFQNYFRMYEKLAGMTGTAFTESAEFKGIYSLDVVVIPTNRQLVRVNFPDRVYKTEREKFSAVVDEIIELHASGRPVLVGTISIDKSEQLSAMLTRKGVVHQVLNAKYHEMEASIVAQAGRFKAVTIATNMAGRGTDILLGGNPAFMARSVVKQKLSPDDPAFEEQYRALLEHYKKEASKEHDQVVEAGGLHVLGTSRHEARRIDNQLRGRSGRQGDPGSSRFYVALEDELMRLFGSDRLAGLMGKLGLEDGQVIEHPWVAGSIEIAQRRVEQHNFEVRKQLLEYDNVMNKQREIIYGQRKKILEGGLAREDILGMAEALSEQLVAGHTSVTAGLEAPALSSALKLRFGIDLGADELEHRGRDAAPGAVYDAVVKALEEKEQSLGVDVFLGLSRMIVLQITDSKWKDHLYSMDLLREGIGLRAYGQRDPLIEYKREAFGMFSAMISGIDEESLELLLKVEGGPAHRFKGVFSNVQQELVHADAAGMQDLPGQHAPAATPPASPPLAQPSAVRHAGPKVGRNDSCPCGSGKKFKKCCGQ